MENKNMDTWPTALRVTITWHDGTVLDTFKIVSKDTIDYAEAFSHSQDVIDHVRREFPIKDQITYVEDNG